MALRVFGDDPTEAPKRQRFSDDVVGRFRSGSQIDDKPISLSEWRVTTGDPEVAAEVFDLLGGSAPVKWEAKGEDDLEVLTASSSVEIIIERTSALRQRMTLWGRQGKPIYSSDGAYKLDDRGRPTDEPDPDASLSFQARKAKAREGTGPTPDIVLYFRLADAPVLGVFKFSSGSWSLVSDLSYHGTEDLLADAIGDSESGQAKAILSLDEVSFTAKNGDRAGTVVTFTKPSIKIVGPHEPDPVDDAA